MTISKGNIAIVFLCLITSSIIGIACAFLPISISSRFGLLISVALLLLLAWGYRAHKTAATEKRLSFIAIIATSLFVLWPQYAFIGFGGLPRVNPYTLTAAFGTFTMLMAVIHYKNYFTEILSKTDGIRHFVTLFISWTIWRFFCNTLSNSPISTNIELIRELVFTYSIFGFSFIICIQPNGVRTLTRLLTGCTLIIVIFGIIEAIEGRNRFTALAASGESGDLAGVIATITAEKLRGGNYRVQSVFGHPILFGQFLGAVLPVILISLYLEKSRIWRLFALLSIPAIAIGIYTSGSRSGVMAALVSCLTLTAMVWYGIVTSSKKYRAIALALIPVFLVACLFSYGIWTELISGTSHSETNSSLVRITQLQLAMSAIDKNPIFGFGLGSALGIAGVMTSLNVPTMDIFYLSVLLDSGWIGIALFSSLVIALFAHSIKKISNNSSGKNLYVAAYTASAASAIVTLGAIAIPQNIVFVFFAASVIAGIDLYDTDRS